MKTWECSAPIPEIAQLGRLHIQLARDGMPMERHDSAFELLLLESGTKRITVNSQAYQLHGGDVLLLRPGEMHGDPEQVQNRTSMIFLIFPDPAGHPGFLDMTEDERQALSLFLHAEAPSHCHVTGEVQRHFVSLLNACRADDGFMAQTVKRAHMALLLEGYRRCVRLPGMDMSPEIRRVVDKITADRDCIPTVGELAAFSYLSESRFKQKFRQQTGMPPMEFILRHKLQEALKIMDSRGLSIPRIASELGFSSDKHFTDAFRRYIGLTPTQYMNRKKTD